MIDQTLQNVVFLVETLLLSQLGVCFQGHFEIFYFCLDFMLESRRGVLFEFLVEQDDSEESRNRKRRLLPSFMIQRNPVYQVQGISFFVIHFERIHQKHEYQRNQKNPPDEDEKSHKLSHQSDGVVVPVPDCADRDDNKIKDVQIVHKSSEVLLLLTYIKFIFLEKRAKVKKFLQFDERGVELGQPHTKNGGHKHNHTDRNRDKYGVFL